MNEPMIEVEGLHKAFGETRALDGVDLCVPAATVLGLLGPNSAGKTTLVKVLATLLEPDAGWARVAGRDVVREPTAVRSMIGLAGQYAAVDEVLTGRENLELVGRLYRLSAPEARRRAEAALEQLSLTDAADRPVRTYSGGMRRRLDLGASLVGRPRILILDEPTTGLDPRTRMELWAFIQQLVRDGTTVLLTTQYLEEADELAESIVVIDHGRVIARGTSDELKSQLGGDVLEVGVEEVGDVDRGADRCSVPSAPSTRRWTAGAAIWPSPPLRGRARWSRRSGPSTRPRSRSPTWPSGDPPWTTCSSPSPGARPPRMTRPDRRPHPAGRASKDRSPA